VTYSKILSLNGGRVHLEVGSMCGSTSL